MHQAIAWGSQGVFGEGWIQCQVFCTTCLLAKAICGSEWVGKVGCLGWLELIHPPTHPPTHPINDDRSTYSHRCIRWLCGDDTMPLAVSPSPSQPSPQSNPSLWGGSQIA